MAQNSETSVVEEVTAILEGTYLRLLADRHRRVPTWAWLNPLAHGDRGVLRGCVAEGPARHPSSGARGEWLVQLGQLAETLLAVASDDAELSAIQRTVLVPLELAAFERWGDEVTASLFGAAVDDALMRYLGQSV